MRKALLITGISLIIIGAISLVFGFFYLRAYNAINDYKSELLAGLALKAKIFLGSGGVVSAAGIVCLLIRATRRRQY